jgi:HlyD family secretion protein
MKKRSWAWIGALVLVGGALALGKDRLPGLGGGDDRVLAGVEVRRGPLRINVIERGNLRAANNIELVSELEGNNTILYLIPEGTYVEKGTLLVELDSTSLVERRVTQEISFQNADGTYVKAQQNLAIQRSQNVSDVALAERKLDFARRDRTKYVEGDYPQQLERARNEILLAQEELKRAQDRLDWSTELNQQGFLTRTELEADQLALQRAQIKIEQAESDLMLLREYDNPRELERLQADVVEAERELERVNLQAAARLVDYEADLRTSKARLDLEREKLDRLMSQIEKSKIYAPAAGMVVYAQQDGGRWRSADPIAEGTQVRERQAIVTIPATSGMIAQASLHESVLEKVEVGQRVIVRVDALPDRDFEGRVRFKAVLPDQNSWFANPNLRLYRCDIDIVGADPRMRPGMSCSLEIIVEEIPDATFVPVQSIFLSGGEPVTFVAKGREAEMRPVRVGRNNAAWVQILEGLEPGETVLLSQPPGSRLESAVMPDETAPEDEQRGPLDGGTGGAGGSQGPGAQAVGAGAGAPAGRARTEGETGAQGAGRGPRAQTHGSGAEAQ